MAKSPNDDFEMLTVGGYPLDEVMSALQKEIRRGHEKEALYWAIELNSKFPNVTWKRLVTIVTEDIGSANPPLVNTIANLYQVVMNLRKESKDHSYDLCILSYAVIEMVRSPKSREADDAVNQILRERREGQFVLDIPDYALDKHTKRGKAKKRGPKFFWSDGAKLENEAFPSKYKGWDDQYGDGYYRADETWALQTLKGRGRGAPPQASMFGDQVPSPPIVADPDRSKCDECNADLDRGGHYVTCSNYGTD